MPEPSPVNIWSLSDLCTPWCMHVVATLHIAERIAGGVDTIDGLAQAANCDREALQSIMGHLVRKGVFEEPVPGHFQLNDVSRDLLDPPVRLMLDLESIGGRMAHAWSTLLEFTRSGEPAYARIFGLPFWEDLEAHPQIAADFDALIGPAGHGTPDPRFDLTTGWDEVKTMVDVGGGTGAMLAEILRAHPRMHGILVDQPETVERSGELFQQAGVMDRVETVGQSFFDPLPPGADLYLLRGILNDWPDREAAAILRRCAEAVPPQGRVVILKGGLDDGEPRDLTIEMVLLGGKYRTVEEFRQLANQAGLEVIAAGQQETYFVVECRKV
jgi:2,7-dihydroxy-5-methyl-1-naphthoate 7-O-methyltransferase